MAEMHKEEMHDRCAYCGEFDSTGDSCGEVCSCSIDVNCVPILFSSLFMDKDIIRDKTYLRLICDTPSGDVIARDAVEIHYCPVCGRKL